ncbi:hypothetical protein GCM10027188_01540 [Lysobacter humi (ex Lee et al. 2017)]
MPAALRVPRVPPAIALPKTRGKRHPGPVGGAALRQIRESEPAMLLSKMQGNIARPDSDFTKSCVDGSVRAAYVVPVEGAAPARAGLIGNPVGIRDCPAAVSGNDPRHWHWPERLGSDAQ